MTDPKSARAQDVGPCIHRWVLGAARAGATQGTCRHCQAVRTFTDAARTWPNAGKEPPRRGQRPPTLGRGSEPTRHGASNG